MSNYPAGYSEQEDFDNFCARHSAEEIASMLNKKNTSTPATHPYPADLTTARHGDSRDPKPYLDREPQAFRDWDREANGV